MTTRQVTRKATYRTTQPTSNPDILTTPTYSNKNHDQITTSISPPQKKTSQEKNPPNQRTLTLYNPPWLVERVAVFTYRFCTISEDQFETKWLLIRDKEHKGRVVWLAQQVLKEFRPWW